MDFKLDVNDFNANYKIVSLGSAKAGNLKVTSTQINGTAIPKLTRGKQTYNAPTLNLIVQTENGQEQLKNCSVRLMNPVDLDMLAEYRAEGVVLYKSWSNAQSVGVNHQFYIEKLVKVGAENNPKQG